MNEKEIVDLVGTHLEMKHELGRYRSNKKIEIRINGRFYRGTVETVLNFILDEYEVQ